MDLTLEPAVDRPGAVLQAWLIDDADCQFSGRRVDLGAYVDTAYKRVSERYPPFAYRFARESGLLDVPGWDGLISAYWLLPFSEKSPLRTRLIVRLYRLTLLEAAIQEHRPVELRVATNDEPLFRVVAELGKRYGLRTSRLLVGCRSTEFKWLSTLFQALDRPLLQHWRAVCLFLLGALRLMRSRLAMIRNHWAIRRLLQNQANRVVRALSGLSGPLVAFYTRYPVLWEFPSGSRPRERNFGTFPDFMARQGFRVAYPCVLSCSVAELRAGVSDIVKQAEQTGLVFLESMISAWEFLKVYLGFAHVWRYLQWRRGMGGRPIVFDGLDVRELVLRELDWDFLYDQELLVNYARAYGMRRFCGTCHPLAVFHPFEYQPMERAVYGGTKAGWAQTAVVGMQTSVYFSGWMSYVYAQGEVSRRGGIPMRSQASLPDYVVAYGTLFKEALSSQYVPDRVLLTGAIRYPEIQQSASVDHGGAIDLDDHSEVRILVIGSLTRGETLQLLRASAEVARALPEVYFLIKFHYHLPLHEEWERLAAEYGCRRFKVFDADLAALLRVSNAVILASSAVVVEAIAMGCMPVVLQNNTEYTFFPAMDIREALFLCDDVSSLVDALHHCVKQTPAYLERRKAWPDVIERMVYRLDGRQDERLFEQLAERGVL